MKDLKFRNGYIQAAPSEWIAVGNASRFAIFEKKKGSSLKFIKSFDNESAHLKVSDLESDKPGRSFDSFSRSTGGHQSGTPRHSYTSHQDPKEHAMDNMVKDVATFLDHGHSTHSFDRLILVANSRLLGKMRLALEPATQEAITAQHSKDFAWVFGEDLQERVQTLILPL